MTQAAVLELPTDDLHRMGRARKPPTEQVRIYIETAADIRAACAALRMDFADYVSDRLRPILKADLEESAKRNLERASQLNGGHVKHKRKRPPAGEGEE